MRATVTLTEVGVVTDADTIARNGHHVFEYVGHGVTNDTLVYVLDRGSGQLVRLTVGQDGRLANALASLGRGRRVLGRLLQPRCVVLAGRGEVAVGEGDGVVTLFDVNLVPVRRIAFTAISDVAGLAAASHGDWLVLVSRGGRYDQLLRVGTNGTDTVRTGIEWLSPPTGADTSLAGASSSGSMVRLPDGSLLIGSSALPAVARVSALGESIWDVTIATPDIADLLPENAPSNLRASGFRVSSIAPLPDSSALVSVFRPGRPQTVVVRVTSQGRALDQAVVPYPLWFLGVARSKYVVAARIRAYSELVVYALP